jgi:hypothetical protein
MTASAHPHRPDPISDAMTAALAAAGGSVTRAAAREWCWDGACGRVTFSCDQWLAARMPAATPLAAAAASGSPGPRLPDLLTLTQADGWQLRAEVPVASAAEVAAAVPVLIAAFRAVTRDAPPAETPALASGTLVATCTAAGWPATERGDHGAAVALAGADDGAHAVVTATATGLRFAVDLTPPVAEDATARAATGAFLRRLTAVVRMTRASVSEASVQLEAFCIGSEPTAVDHALSALSHAHRWANAELNALSHAPLAKAWLARVSEAQPQNRRNAS